MNILPAVLDCSAVITQHTYNGETLGKRIADLPVNPDEGSTNLFGYHLPALLQVIYAVPARRDFFALGAFTLSSVIFLLDVNTYIGDDF